MPKNKTKEKSALRKLLDGFLLILLGIFVLLSLIGFATERWLFRTWAALAMDEILFHLSSSLKGTNPEMVQTYILNYGIYILLAFAVFIVSMVISKKNRTLRAVFVCFWIALSLGLLEYSFYDLDQRISLRDYFVQSAVPAQEQTGDFIHDHYVDAGTASITFPEKKRNLIYIYLESMEMTYSDRKNGGAFSKNVIPELTKIAKENEDFSGGSSLLNGAVSLPGTTWTMGAMFGQSTGMPLKLPISGLQIDSQIVTNFFPALTALGDVLQNEGYQQVLMIGSDASFGGRKSYFDSHGAFEIFDYTAAKNESLLPKDYFVFWGFEDSRLFDFAKDKLLSMAKTDQPFNLTLLTVDTHFEDGYVCPLCQDKFDGNQYANVMACSSRQVSAFVKWIQEQDFYKNTTIVLCGDHPTMDTDFCKDVPSDYQRRTYTAIINSAAKPVDPSRERLYSTMDLYPTTLASLGAVIRGNRLGLGTNLFSLSDTLLEQYGIEKCTKELDKPSAFMDSFSNISITAETMEEAAEAAKLSYRVEDDGNVTFVLNYAYALNSSSVKSAVLELTDGSGETTTVKMEIYQPKTDPNVFWCLGKTTMKESDIHGLKAEAFFNVSGFDHYLMDTFYP